MQDRPSFGELLDSVREFLEQEIAPGLTDHRARFRTLVAINALTILRRELDHELDLVREEASGLVELLAAAPELPKDPERLRARVLELNRELAARIRNGEPPDGTLEHLRRVGAAKLRVASPGYLGRYDA